jgi:TRAP-type C4-dicarboxylate transport system permease small subunit
MPYKLLISIGQIYYKAIEWIAACIIVLVTISMLETAASRTIFNFPWSVMDNINVIAMIWACFLITGLLVENEAHIAVTFLPSRLKGLPLYFLKLFINTSLLATFCVITYYGFLAYKTVKEMGIVYPAEIDIPQCFAYLPVFVGMMLGIPFVVHVLIRNISTIICTFKEKRNNR